MKKALFISIAAFLFSIQVVPAFSHPHVFIDAKLIFVFDGQGLSGIRERWAFDEMFSQDLLSSFDNDRDGKLNQNDVTRLRDIFYENTKAYNYFNVITIDGRKYKINTISDFSIFIQDDRIVYEFFIPCPVQELSSGDQKVKVLLFDETIYTHLLIEDYQVDMRKNPGGFIADMKYEMLDEVVTPLGSLVPDSVVITFRKK